MVPLFAVRTHSAGIASPSWICLLLRHMMPGSHTSISSVSNTDLSSSTTGPGHGRTAKVSEHPASLYISSRTSPSDVNTLHNFLSGPISRRDSEFKATDRTQIEPSGTLDLIHHHRTKLKPLDMDFFLALIWISPLPGFTLGVLDPYHGPQSQRSGVRMSQAQGCLPTPLLSRVTMTGLSDRLHLIHSRPRVWTRTLAAPPWIAFLFFLAPASDEDGT